MDRTPEVRAHIQAILDAEARLDSARKHRDDLIAEALRSGQRAVDIAAVFERALSDLGLHGEDRFGLGVSESSVRLVQRRYGIRGPRQR